jgi:hypothetical protein
VRVEAQSTLSKIIVYATIASGFVAAYLMDKRGESPVAIARNTVTNPIGSLVSEVQNAVWPETPEESKCEICREFALNHPY